MHSSKTAKICRYVNTLKCQENNNCPLSFDSLLSCVESIILAPLSILFHRAFLCKLQLTLKLDSVLVERNSGKT